MSNLLRFIIAFTITTLLWAPYYIWGVAKGNDFLANNKFVSASFWVAGTLLLGFIGLHFIQRYLLSGGSTISTVNFRLMLILTTQAMAVLLIAWDSNFNWLAITAGVFVLIGAVLGSFAVS
jgi:hypothetical protein